MFEDVPEGYPALITLDGQTWQERQNKFKEIYGKEVEPIGPIPENLEDILAGKCKNCKKEKEV